MDKYSNQSAPPLCKVCKMGANEENCSQSCCRKSNADIWEKNKKVCERKGLTYIFRFVSSKTDCSYGFSRESDLNPESRFNEEELRIVLVSVS